MWKPCKPHFWGLGPSRNDPQQQARTPFVFLGLFEPFRAPRAPHTARQQCFARSFSNRAADAMISMAPCVYRPGMVSYRPGNIIYCRNPFRDRSPGEETSRLQSCQRPGRCTAARLQVIACKQGPASRVLLAHTGGVPPGQRQANGNGIAQHARSRANCSFRLRLCNQPQAASAPTFSRRYGLPHPSIIVPFTPSRYHFSLHKHTAPCVSHTHASTFSLLIPASLITSNVVLNA